MSMGKTILGLIFAFGFLARLTGAESGDRVLVIYNSKMPGSKEIAQHYAERRNVPSSQILGLKLPREEVISRAEFRDRLFKPVLDFVQSKHLITFSKDKPSAAGATNSLGITSSSIRYAVLCYGVPLRIAEDPSLVEEKIDQLPAPLRRNGASVDAELALLPWRNHHRVTGPLQNLFYSATNAALMNPTNGLLMVARLDGPSPEIANALVDKAMSAETNGLWGRAYFDSRGLTNSDYLLGDQWIRTSYEFCRRFGFESYLDDNPSTLPAAFPLSQVALYAGWYDGDASGPFAQPSVEFMPGAFAYHLHSYSAATLRSTNKNWVGPLLASGATATFGYVDEPYLQTTSDLVVFFSRWLGGQFSFGEAAYAAQPTLSWQTTVIGDPLYHPFDAPLQQLHQALSARHSPLIEWSHLLVCNRNEMMDLPVNELIKYLEAQEITRKSPVLTEKLADYYEQIGKKESSARATERALELNPSPKQRVRLTFSLADKLAALGKEEESFKVCQKFYQETPGYPDRLGLCKKLEGMAEKLKRTDDVETYNAEIKRLSAPKT